MLLWILCRKAFCVKESMLENEMNKEWRKERRVVKGTKRRNSKKGTMFWGIVHDGGIDVDCKALYTRTKSKVGKMREINIAKKVPSCRDCNKAEINKMSRAL
jgi:hypothetical protein